MMFEKGKWYKTSEGYDVEFIVPIKKDGMYNVFRQTEGCDYRPYYTDAEGVTAYGERIICEASND